MRNTASQPRLWAFRSGNNTPEGPPAPHSFLTIGLCRTPCMSAIRTLECAILGCAGSCAPPNTLKSLWEAAWPSYTPGCAKPCTCRESGSSIKLFKNFRETSSIRTPFTIEGIHGGALLAVRGQDFVAFYDWGTAEVRGLKPGCTPTLPPPVLGARGSWGTSWWALPLCPEVTVRSASTTSATQDLALACAHRAVVKQLGLSSNWIAESVGSSWLQAASACAMLVSVRYAFSSPCWLATSAVCTGQAQTKALCCCPALHASAAACAAHRCHGARREVV